MTFPDYTEIARSISSYKHSKYMSERYNKMAEKPLGFNPMTDHEKEIRILKCEKVILEGKIKRITAKLERTKDWCSLYKNACKDWKELHDRASKSCITLINQLHEMEQISENWRHHYLRENRWYKGVYIGFMILLGYSGFITYLRYFK